MKEDDDDEEEEGEKVMEEKYLMYVIPACLCENLV